MNDNYLNNIIPLNSLPIGEKCKVNHLVANGIIRRRFLDLGLINGTEVESLGQSPSGDPIAYLIRGAVIAIRSEDASKILVETI
ncbi:FeoA family protein [Clostridium weizhouense]|uniref:Ferrous iron transport protein A n=1 Tax=Clostridium weizhouense TaxID=2859781 RepID=A0ABS7ALQ8_9CLOT|nr:FeoA family protein [Clostridium weizhouense]MBW6409572.1 ferrous iron transport protein A [Clostridium weizhouense]